MSDAAASTMILADLDEALHELLERELAARGLLGVNVTFEAPSRERVAQWPSPAIDRTKPIRNREAPVIKVT